MLAGGPLLFQLLRDDHGGMIPPLCDPNTSCPFGPVYTPPGNAEFGGLTSGGGGTTGGPGGGDGGTVVNSYSSEPARYRFSGSPCSIVGNTMFVPVGLET